ncbi:hypothetical protein CRYUN_Cryun13aG0109300 [Craigia yunnanensis]
MPNFDSTHVVETAKVKYSTSLSNVDWLHGGAESLLILTNLFIVLGLRQAFRKTEGAKESTSSSVRDVKKAEALHVDGCYVTIVLLRIPQHIRNIPFFAAD